MLKRYSVVLMILQKNEELMDVLEEMYYLNMMGMKYTNPIYQKLLDNLFVHFCHHNIYKVIYYNL